ncbi:MAG: hypothetical protein MJE63_17420 [Proteobacteria bacterium]|nr:hypothetical protein [Pseudomonadota bacterium]
MDPPSLQNQYLLEIIIQNNLLASLVNDSTSSDNRNYCEQQCKNEQVTVHYSAVLMADEKQTGMLDFVRYPTIFEENSGLFQTLP